MKRVLFIFLFIILIFEIQVCFSQAPDWSRVLQVNTSALQNVNVVATDANNFYFAASISSTLVFEGNTYTSVGMQDLLIVKTNNSGIPIWWKQINAQSNGTIYANALKVDDTGNVFVSGIFSGATTIGSNTLTSNATNNAFMAKIDVDGNGIWGTSFLSNGSGSSKIALDNIGNSYLLSSSNKLIKFNNLGTLVWEQNYPDRTLQAIAIHGSNLYLGGTLQSNTTFGTINLLSSGAYNTGFLLRADLDGVFNKSMVVELATRNDGSSVCDILINNSGDLIITGGYQGSIKLGSISITNQSYTPYYTYVAKCNSDFTFFWLKPSSILSDNYRSIFTYRLFFDSSNNIYELGMNNCSLSFGDVAIPKTYNTQQFLAKFDADGNPVDGYAIYNATYNKTIVTPPGKILTSGSYNYSGAPSYGNFYFCQYQVNMALDWQRISSNSSSSGIVNINAVKHDGAGNTYLQSRIIGNCNFFGTNINTNAYITLISKHDATGKLLWTRQITDLSPSSFGSIFTLDKDDNVLTIGLFQTSIVVGSTILTSTNTGNEGYVAKFNSNGEFLWATKLNLNTNVSTNIALATDVSGNILVSGVISPSNYLVKFNASGAQLWAKTFPMESYYISLVSTDANDNIYLASEIHLSDNSGSTTIGSIQLTQTYNDGATALIKFDPNGNALWAKTFGGVTGASYSDSWPVDIKTDENGNSYLWGWCPTNATFGSTTLTNPINQNYSFYLTKINTTGNVEWANAVYETKSGFNYGDLLDLDKAGNIYVGGHFKNLIKIGNNNYNPEGLNDFFVAKYSNNGEFQWIKTIPANADIIRSLSVLKDDVLTIGGSAGKNSTLGSFTIEKKGGSSCIIATLGDLPYLNLSAKSIFLGAEINNSNAINITSNTDWTVVADQTWITIDNLSGNGNKTIGISATANQNPNARNAILTIKGSGTPTKTIQITQNGYVAPSSHFIPVWSGSGVDHMNIHIYSAILDGVELSVGDEIGIFDGNICVGVGTLTGLITPTNTLDIVVSRNDGSGNGYTSGSSITFKFFNSNKNVEIANVTAIYSNIDPSWSTDGKFSIGTMALAALAASTLVQQDITLNTGWNIISANVVPTNLNLKDIFQPLIDAGRLKKVMDETGKTIENLGAFGGWKNSIGNLNSNKGYKVNVTASSTLSLEGTPIELPYSIALNAGWNIISYPSASIQDAKAVFQSLIDAGKLKKVMDEAGKTIENLGAFGGWKNSIGNFIPGKGYKVNVTANCTLTIPAGGSKSAVIMRELLASEHFTPIFKGNGTDHMNVHLVNLPNSGLQAGDEIGIFDGNLCVGSAAIGEEQLRAESISISASNNDELSENANGFTSGHPVELRLYRGGQTYQMSLTKVSGNEVYEKNGSLLVEANANNLIGIQITDLSAEFKCYPNPFTQAISIEIQVSNQEEITVEIYNMAGQRIKTLYKGSNNGKMILKWNGTDNGGQKVAPGAYLCKVNDQSKQVIFE